MQVAREGTKKTAFGNFMELVELMKRNHEHVMSFILSEVRRWRSVALACPCCYALPD